MLNLKRSIMKGNHFITRRWFGTFALATMSTLILGSCATDGFDEDESFVRDVTNTQLLSPSADDITITASTDGSKTVISWNIVDGAGGYNCHVLNVTDPDNPVVVKDTLMDNNTFAVTREEDANYSFSIRTLGDEKLGNTTAEDSTVVSFSTFSPSYTTIPAGTNLTEYFAQNAIPDSSDIVTYDLEGGAKYTLSDFIDFGAHKVMLRCQNKANKAKVIMASETAGIRTAAAMTLKNLYLDYSASSEPVISLSKDAPASILNLLGGTGGYYIIKDGAIYVNNCEIEGVNNKFMYDNNVKYCLENFLMDNSVVHFTTNTTSIESQAYFYYKAGFIKTLTIKNSSLYNTGSSSAKYVIQYNNSGRASRAGYDATEPQGINFLNNTFYNLGISGGQFCNYSAFVGQSNTTFDVESNIFVNCCVGGGGIARRILGQKTASSYKAGATFGLNTYWADGAAESGSESYDDSGKILTTDPALVNPAAGDLTPQGAEQLSYKTGDPRWLTAE